MNKSITFWGIFLALFSSLLIFSSFLSTILFTLFIEVFLHFKDVALLCLACIAAMRILLSFLFFFLSTCFHFCLSAFKYFFLLLGFSNWIMMCPGVVSLCSLCLEFTDPYSCTCGFIVFIEFV